MSKTRQYFCYTCSEEVTFRGTRIRYNLDGSLHLCKADDRLAYDKYLEYIFRDNTWWRPTGEDFWKWKWEIYDDYAQRWTQSRDYNNELKELREREQQRAAEAEAEERRKADEAEARRQKAAEEAAAEQRRAEQRKQAARKKRRAARERSKRRKQAEAAAKEAEAHEREHQAEGRRSRNRGHEPGPHPGGRLGEALKIMGLTVDIQRLSSKEAVTMIRNRFRALAMIFHPDRGGDAKDFMAMNDASEYLLHHLMNKI